MRNSTIIPKQKMLSCGHFGFNFSKGRCVDCARFDSFSKKQNEEIEKESGLPELIKEADSVFSTYIRLKYADKNGIVKCFTCDEKLPYTQAQNGHYISRACMYLRYCERNTKPQCSTCNCIKNGNLGEYGKRLEQERQGITEILYEEKNIIYKPSRAELIQIINEYTQKNIQLKKKLKN
jgi:hypothetical protein